MQKAHPAPAGRGWCPPGTRSQRWRRWRPLRRSRSAPPPRRPTAAPAPHGTARPPPAWGRSDSSAGQQQRVRPAAAAGLHLEPYTLTTSGKAQCSDCMPHLHPHSIQRVDSGALHTPSAACPPANASQCGCGACGGGPQRERRLVRQGAASEWGPLGHGHQPRLARQHALVHCEGGDMGRLCQHACSSSMRQPALLPASC